MKCLTELQLSETWVPFKAGVNLCMQLSSFSILAVTASATAASFSSAVLSGSSSATGSPVFGPGSAVGFPANCSRCHKMKMCTHRDSEVWERLQVAILWQWAARPPTPELASGMQ